MAVSSGADLNLVDALPGGTLGEVILLAQTERLPNVTTAWLEGSADTEHAWVLGGENALTAAVADELRELLATE